MAIKVDFYRCILITTRSDADAIIKCYKRGKRNPFAILYFVGGGSSNIKDPYVGGTPYKAWFPEDYYERIVDLLRNEGPVFISLTKTSGDDVFRIYSDKEGVGEEG